MKIAALMDRGTKRDFVDLYELSHKGITIEDMFVLYDKKYGALENNMFSILRSIGYFDDAEKGDTRGLITCPYNKKTRKPYRKSGIIHIYEFGYPVVSPGGIVVKSNL